ncbi:hypothetical protein [Peribacillus loiseleuriae]|uniref:hypothetical protein n=1 Tax=Peribacillus loiseleuriae TaxID=1679170 RepID=UPI000670BD4D|nr:hypothetical protein [Peribacillus loiseleuriae]
MIVKVEFMYEEDNEYIRCPAKVGRNICQLQRDFDKWLYDGENNHPYWVVADEDEEGNKIYGVCFNAEAFVFWLNNVRFNKGKKVAKLIETPNKPAKKKIRF